MCHDQLYESNILLTFEKSQKSHGLDRLRKNMVCCEQEEFVHNYTQQDFVAHMYTYKEFLLTVAIPV
jgi:hypothetical protein